MRRTALSVREVNEIFMLPILGILMFLLWLLDTAFDHPAGSVVHLLAILACLSFVGEFFRRRAVAFLQRQNSRPYPSQAEPAKPSEVAPRALDSEFKQIH